MAIIPQQSLFVWSDIENLADLERFRLVLEYIPNEELMNTTMGIYKILKKLLGKAEKIDEIFNNLVKELSKLLPEFGENIAIDSKAISSLAKHKNRNEKKDGRRDIGADYELPVAYEVTKATISDIKEAHEIIDKLHEKRPEIIKNVRQ